jgi:hypothetical protein
MRTYLSYTPARFSQLMRKTTMIPSNHIGSAILVATLLTIGQTVRAQMMGAAAHYEGRWELQANGDVKVTRIYKLPMQLYTSWKENSVHMLEARNFAGERSSVEVAAQKADWDDLNQTLTMTMTVLGMGQNKAGHWEAKVLPYLEFSNLDETHKIAYFHFSTQGEMGRVEGQDLIICPPACTKASWDNARKMVVYVLPAPEAARGGGGLSAKGLWWVSAVVCLAAGAGLWVASFLIRPKPNHNPAASIPA